MEAQKGRTKTTVLFKGASMGFHVSLGERSWNRAICISTIAIAGILTAAGTGFI